ncbi:MAG: hypothetical protein AB7G47_16005 [Mycolicibacterium sp.]|uniref:hypothetical protein n=1 Tax=Mycolicibacterium sp. TaxID=2320850 RepID=UPI003D138D78
MLRGSARLVAAMFACGLFLAGPSAAGVAAADVAGGSATSSGASSTAGSDDAQDSGSDTGEPRTAAEPDEASHSSDPGSTNNDEHQPNSSDDPHGVDGAPADVEEPADNAPHVDGAAIEVETTTTTTTTTTTSTTTTTDESQSADTSSAEPVAKRSESSIITAVAAEQESAKAQQERPRADIAAEEVATEQLADGREGAIGSGRPATVRHQAEVPGGAAAVEYPAQSQSLPRATTGVDKYALPNRPLETLISKLFDAADNWLAGLPRSPITEFLEGVLYLVRRTFFDFDETIVIPEIDSATSKFAVRVDPQQQLADAIKVDAGTLLTLTVPRPASSYTVVANKPDLVDISQTGNMIQLNVKTPGFLGLAIRAKDDTSDRYLGVYIADSQTHVVLDGVEGYLPVGSVGAPDDTGDEFLQSFNFRDGIAPIDYLYIYDQGGANYTDGTVKALLAQALRHGLVPVIVFYNIQNVLNSAGDRTGVIEGPDSAYQAINDYDQSGEALFDGYMKSYFTKLGTAFTTMNRLGVPVQVVMEPDFLGYMKTALPSATLPQSFVPDKNDRTLNTAQTSAIYDAGLLTRGTDPEFANTAAGFVQAVNYYVGHKAPNLRIGWMTNIWSVADQQNYSLGLLHMTDSVTYPWQGQWTGPAPTWDDGRTFIAEQAAGLGAFLDKVGVLSWSGAADRAPFLTIDKYGVDGAYTYDPDMLATQSGTAAFTDLQVFVSGAYANLPNVTDAAIQKYFGLTKDGLKTFYEKYSPLNYRPVDSEITAVFTTLQNAAEADPNMAKWFLNADQWNNYLYLVEGLSKALGGVKVMLWQIPQGHINGSTVLPGTDLTDTDANFEDSAPSYFFGDSFTAPGGRLIHFGANQAGDPAVTVSGTTVSWGEHMTLAQKSGVMSVLFGAGLGVSTRGAPTGIGGITDKNFWYDKATAYLSKR